MPLTDKQKGYKTMLQRAYLLAGNDYLAYRIEKIFIEIKTEEEKALHNDVVIEIRTMVEHDYGGFIKEMVNVLTANLSNKMARKRRFRKFLKQVAKKIMLIAGKSKG